MMAFKSLVAATAALLFFQGANARVTRRNGTPAGPFCTDFTPFNYAGCFTDPGSPRALPFSSNISSNAMTTEICVSFCKGNGYRYAGLEYYGECWCGASVQGVQVADSQCNFPCTGNNSESCGGNSLLTVYQDPTFPLDNTSVISDYTPSGCWSDSGSSGRALVYRQNALATSTLTVEQCLFSCKAGGYPLAGVEFGSECYCGVVLGNGTAQVASSQCSMPCNGNNAEICGGPALLNLYVATDLESSQPCLNLSPSPPVSSSNPSSTSSSLTTSTSSKSSTTTTTLVTTPTNSPTTSPTTTLTSTSTTKTTIAPTTNPTSPTTAPTTTLTTTMMTSTTTKTTSSIALCTTTIAPKCEYSCGSWCSNPIPTWSGSSDCKTAASNCLLQVAGCFAHATFPDSLKCFEYSSWCDSVSSYCSSNCAWGKCSKDDCTSKYPPAGNPSTPTTSVYTCPPTSAPTSSKPSSTTCTSVPVPTSSNICQQPNNAGKGYTSSSPCGGIALPCLTCNNIKSDYDSGSCFKLYTSQDSSKCSSYKKPSVSQGCKDACLAQYNSCVGTYAESCKSSWKEKREASANPNWGWGGWGGDSGDDYDSASQKCQWQYQDCLSINANVNPSPSRCSSWNSGW